MVDWTKHIVAGVVGVGDRMAQDWDANINPPRTKTFQTASDLGRLGIVVVGLGVQAWQPRYSSYGEAMSLGGLPLLVQSVWKAVAEGTGDAAPAARKVTYTPQRITAPKGAAQRYPAPTNQSQFKNTRLE